MKTVEILGGSQPAGIPFKSRRKRRLWMGWMFALPAALFYAIFNLWPILTAVRLSFYSWDGIGQMSWVGLKNYYLVFSDPQLLASLRHAFYLIIFFSFLPVTFGLISASVMRQIRGKVFGSVARVVLFLPQIIPGAAAAVAWTWMYSGTGLVNQIMLAIGLGHYTQAWLGSFQWALTAVGFIGTWLSTGFCTLLLIAGIGKIDIGLYEAAQIDGANALDQFRVITLPGLRQEIGVCLTLTIISALASFDVVYLATGGGPGYQTTVPGVEVYNLAFVDSTVGAGCALGVVLSVIVNAVVLPLQRFFRER